MKKSKTCRGSVTIEAVFIVPFICFIIIFLLYFALYMRDKALVYTTISEGINRQNQVLHHPRDLKEGGIWYDKLTDRSLLYNLTDSCEDENKVLKNYIKTQLADRLCLCSVENVNVEKSYMTISAGVTMKPDINFGFGIIPIDDLFKVDATVCKEIHNPADFARKCDVFLDTISDVKGFDRVISALQKAMDLLN